MKGMKLLVSCNKETNKHWTQGFVQAGTVSERTNNTERIYLHRPIIDSVFVTTNINQKSEH